MLLNVKSLLILLIISSSVISVLRKLKYEAKSNRKIQAKSKDYDSSAGEVWQVTQKYVFKD